MLQNSQNAGRLIFREKTKQATIADQCSLKPVTGIAREFDARGVVPHIIIRSPHPRLGKFVFSDPKRLLQQYPPREQTSPRPAGQVRKVPRLMQRGSFFRFPRRRRQERSAAFPDWPRSRHGLTYKPSAVLGLTEDNLFRLGTWTDDHASPCPCDRGSARRRRLARDGGARPLQTRRAGDAAVRLRQRRCAGRPRYRVAGRNSRWPGAIRTRTLATYPRTTPTSNCCSFASPTVLCWRKPTPIIFATPA